MECESLSRIPIRAMVDTVELKVIIQLLVDELQALVAVQPEYKSPWKSTVLAPDLGK